MVSAKKHFSSTLDSVLKNLSNTGRGRKQAVSIVFDAATAVVALWLAFSLRFGYAFSDFRTTWYLFLLLPVFVVLACMALGIYRWVVRSTNQRLFKQLIKVSVAASLFLVLVMHLFPPDRINPRSLFILFGILFFAGSSSIRLIWQSLFKADSLGEPVAVYGAGIAGQQLVNSLAADKDYRPVIFIDDDQAISDSVVAGKQVIDGGHPDLAGALRRLDIERVILALPSLSRDEYQKKFSHLEKLGFKVKTIPTAAELVSGVASVEQVRNVAISDILGRSEVAPDEELLGRCVAGKTVLVTGGGGSIGSELCVQILSLMPKKLIVLDQSEANLYVVTETLNALLAEHDDNTSEFLPVLCSVLDEQRINDLINSESVDTVYHAAAYKHVPIIEAQPEQGVEVNLFGTKTVLDASIKHNVDNFILISSDKAVRPTNAMGATKRAAELVLQAKAMEAPATKISMVRFGNVLGSSGSVVPKFRKQIESGGPITLTHPDMTRYFMTIPEAAQLVLQASAISQGGDVFVLDMGDPIRISDLAKTMVQLMGKNLASETGDPTDIDIVVQGLRPGEKLFEELFIDASHTRTLVQKVFTANEVALPWYELEPLLNELTTLIAADDRQALREKLILLANSGRPISPTTRRIVQSDAEKTRVSKQSSNGRVKLTSV